jgi:dephospho-CoA kinase
MLECKRIAVTGALASGKSTVCAFFRDLGAYVVSADTITHQLLLSDTALIQKVCSLLGNSILVNGAIDRNKVADQVFQKPELLHKLEKIIHPAVKQGLEHEWNKALLEGAPLFVAEVPLLFEAAFEPWFDATIAVFAEESCCLERFCLQKRGDLLDYKARMQHQLPGQEKAKRATYIINNQGSLQALRSEVSSLYTQLTGAST